MKKRYYRSIFLGVVALVAVLCAPVTSASANVRCSSISGLSYNSPMKFCMRSDIYVAAVGEITSRTPEDLIAFLRRVTASGLQPHSVTFHSPGGSLVGGIGLGRIIRTLELDTHVGEASRCTSACMLAFIGGWSRKVTHDGRIGNHQIRNALTEIGSIEGIQDLIAYLSDYHREMNVSPLAVNAAMSRRSHEMYWYSREERNEWGIVTRR